MNKNSILTLSPFLNQSNSNRHFSHSHSRSLVCDCLSLSGLCYSIVSLSCSLKLSASSICCFFFCRKMGTRVANKSRNPLAFITISIFENHYCCFHDRLRLRVSVRQLKPFHGLYSTLTGRENLQSPYQNQIQFLKSVRDQCKSRSLRNVDHALDMFDKMLHMRPCLPLTILITCWVPLQD